MTLTNEYPTCSSIFSLGRIVSRIHRVPSLLAVEELWQLPLPVVCGK